MKYVQFVGDNGILGMSNLLFLCLLRIKLRNMKEDVGDKQWVFVY